MSIRKPTRREEPGRLKVEGDGRQNRLLSKTLLAVTFVRVQHHCRLRTLYAKEVIEIEAQRENILKYLRFINKGLENIICKEGNA